MKQTVLAFIAISMALCAFAGDPVPTPRLVNENIADREQVLKSDTAGVVSWAHIGDLHITTAAEQGYTDFQTLVKQANEFLSGSVNFVFLPGDNANEGTEEEYLLIKRVTDRLHIPLFAVPGDHDVESGNLDLFTKYMSPVPYQSFALGRYRMIFLDALDAPAEDRLGFGIGEKQMAWLKGELKTAPANGQRPVLFQHCFPDGTGASRQELLNLIKENHVLLAEVGHTHYNAVSNDGQTIYAATRSTSQVAEGPVGFSITNLDNNVVSWKFKPIGDWPFVMITSPADKRFITNPDDNNQVIRGIIEIHAKVWGGETITSATYQIDQATPKALSQGAGPLWTAKWDSTEVDSGDHILTVAIHIKEGKTKEGRTAEDRASITVNQKGAYVSAARMTGADGNSIGIDPARGLLGTTQGPGGKPPWAGKGKPDKAHED
jgi:3',5'-cyclic AMP phosphodiesterase CpdA